MALPVHVFLMFKSLLMLFELILHFFCLILVPFFSPFVVITDLYPSTFLHSFFVFTSYCRFSTGLCFLAPAGISALFGSVASQPQLSYVALERFCLKTPNLDDLPFLNGSTHSYTFCICLYSSSTGVSRPKIDTIALNFDLSG